VILILLLQSCSSIDIEPEQELAKVCDLPYTRYQATVTGYCQEPAADLITDFPLQEKLIEIRPVEEIPESFWYSEKMAYSFAQQATPAPLAFVIAGTGAGYNSAKNIVLQKILFEQGYHVVALSSTTFSNYIINATNRNDMTGDLSKDANSLYHTMERVYEQLQKEEGIEATSFALTGYSLGGAHAAFIAKLDEQEQHFNFSKVVMVNPPVSLYNSVSILDGYLDIKNHRAEIAAMYDDIFAQLAQSYARQETSRLNEENIYKLFSGAHMTDEKLKVLIGSSFRMSSIDMMYAIEIMYNIGALNYQNHKVSKFESITHSMFRADSLTFVDYFDHAMLPWTQSVEPEVTREQMIDRLSLHSIESFLKNTEKVTVVHNADDIILADGELEYIKEIFGTRAKVFERGGHCGNMDRLSFVEHMKTQFTGANL